MKTILIIRHVESGWEHVLQKDFERTLSNNGKIEAKSMGKELLLKNFSTDCFLCSSALRTKQTAEIIAEEIGYKKEDIIYLESLYNASTFTLTNQITHIDNKHNVATVICHNPGITHFINDTIGTITSNVPTCGMACIKIDTNCWADFETAKKHLLFYDFPKLGLS